MAGIHYLLLIFVSFYNIDNSRAFGDGACKGVTVGDCQLLDEYVIETLSIGISADLCQDICQQKTNCVVFQHSAETCTLLTEDYRQDCGTSGGPTKNSFDNCLGIELNTCDRFLEEDCVYNGEVILNEEDIADAKHCQELCELFEDFGCEYWVYKENTERNHHDCLLLHSDERNCAMTGGPKRPNFIDCATTTSTTSRPTTARTTTTVSPTTTADELGDVVDVAVANGNFKTLVQLLVDLKLVDALKGMTAQTIFAPSDEAFAKLPEGTLDGLTTEQKTAIVLRHVIANVTVPAADVKNGTVVTLGGESIVLIKTGAGGVEIFYMGNVVNVVTADVMASNGVIHVIDAVILPTEDPTTEVPTTNDPTTENPTTVEPTDQTTYPYEPTTYAIDPLI